MTEPQPNLLQIFTATCRACETVWVVGTFLDARHALIAQQLPWLCPECNRPLEILNQPRWPPEKQTKPC